MMSNVDPPPIVGGKFSYNLKAFLGMVLVSLLAFLPIMGVKGDMCEISLTPSRLMTATFESGASTTKYTNLKINCKKIFEKPGSSPSNPEYIYLDGALSYKTCKNSDQLFDATMNNGEGGCYDFKCPNSNCDINDYDCMLRNQQTYGNMFGDMQKMKDSFPELFQVLKKADEAGVLVNSTNAAQLMPALSDPHSHAWGDSGSKGKYQQTGHYWWDQTDSRYQLKGVALGHCGQESVWDDATQTSSEKKDSCRCDLRKIYQAKDVNDRHPSDWPPHEKDFKDNYFLKHHGEIKFKAAKVSSPFCGSEKSKIEFWHSMFPDYSEGVGFPWAMPSLSYYGVHVDPSTSSTSTTQSTTVVPITHIPGWRDDWYNCEGEFPSKAASNLCDSIRTGGVPGYELNEKISVFYKNAWWIADYAEEFAKNSDINSATKEAIERCTTEHNIFQNYLKYTGKWMHPLKLGWTEKTNNYDDQWNQESTLKQDSGFIQFCTTFMHSIHHTIHQIMKGKVESTYITGSDGKPMMKDILSGSDSHTYLLPKHDQHAWEKQEVPREGMDWSTYFAVRFIERVKSSFDHSYVMKVGTHNGKYDSPTPMTSSDEKITTEKNKKDYEAGLYMDMRGHRITQTFEYRYRYYPYSEHGSEFPTFVYHYVGQLESELPKNQGKDMGSSASKEDQKGEEQKTEYDPECPGKGLGPIDLANKLAEKTSATSSPFGRLLKAMKEKRAKILQLQKAIFKKNYKNKNWMMNYKKNKVGTKVVTTGFGGDLVESQHNVIPVTTRRSLYYRESHIWPVFRPPKKYGEDCYAYSEYSSILTKYREDYKNRFPSVIKPMWQCVNGTTVADNQVIIGPPTLDPAHTLLRLTKRDSIETKLEILEDTHISSSYVNLFIAESEEAGGAIRKLGPSAAELRNCKVKLNIFFDSTGKKSVADNIYIDLGKKNAEGKYEIPEQPTNCEQEGVQQANAEFEKSIKDLTLDSNKQCDPSKNRKLLEEVNHGHHDGRRLSTIMDHSYDDSSHRNEPERYLDHVFDKIYGTDDVRATSHEEMQLFSTKEYRSLKQRVAKRFKQKREEHKENMDKVDRKIIDANKKDKASREKALKTHNARVLKEQIDMAMEEDCARNWIEYIEKKMEEHGDLDNALGHSAFVVAYGGNNIELAKLKYEYVDSCMFASSITVAEGHSSHKMGSTLVSGAQSVRRARQLQFDNELKENSSSSRVVTTIGKDVRRHLKSLTASVMEDRRKAKEQEKRDLDIKQKEDLEKQGKIAKQSKVSIEERHRELSAKHQESMQKSMNKAQEELDRMNPAIGGKIYAGLNGYHKGRTLTDSVAESVKSIVAMNKAALKADKFSVKRSSLSKKTTTEKTFDDNWSLSKIARKTMRNEISMFSHSLFLLQKKRGKALKHHARRTLERALNSQKKRLQEKEEVPPGEGDNVDIKDPEKPDMENPTGPGMENPTGPGMENPTGPDMENPEGTNMKDPEGSGMDMKNEPGKGGMPSDKMMNDPTMAEDPCQQMQYMGDRPIKFCAKFAKDVIKLGKKEDVNYMVAVHFKMSENIMAVSKATTDSATTTDTAENGSENAEPYKDLQLICDDEANLTAMPVGPSITSLASVSTAAKTFCVDTLTAYSRDWSEKKLDTAVMAHFTELIAKAIGHSASGGTDSTSTSMQGSDLETARTFYTHAFKCRADLQSRIQDHAVQKYMASMNPSSTSAPVVAETTTTAAPTTERRLSELTSNQKLVLTGGIAACVEEIQSYAVPGQTDSKGELLLSLTTAPTLGGACATFISGDLWATTMGQNWCTFRDMMINSLSEQTNGPPGTYEWTKDQQAVAKQRALLKKRSVVAKKGRSLSSHDATDVAAEKDDTCYKHNPRCCSYAMRMVMTLETVKHKFESVTTSGGTAVSGGNSCEAPPAISFPTCPDFKGGWGKDGPHNYCYASRMVLDLLSGWMYSMPPSVTNLSTKGADNSGATAGTATSSAESTSGATAGTAANSAESTSGATAGTAANSAEPTSGSTAGTAANSATEAGGNTAAGTTLPADTIDGTDVATTTGTADATNRALKGKQLKDRLLQSTDNNGAADASGSSPVAADNAAADASGSSSVAADNAAAASAAGGTEGSPPAATVVSKDQLIAAAAQIKCNDAVPSYVTEAIKATYRFSGDCLCKSGMCDKLYEEARKYYMVTLKCQDNVAGWTLGNKADICGGSCSLICGNLDGATITAAGAGANPMTPFELAQDPLILNTLANSNKCAKKFFAWWRAPSGIAYAPNLVEQMKYMPDLYKETPSDDGSPIPKCTNLEFCEAIKNLPAALTTAAANVATYPKCSNLKFCKHLRNAVTKNGMALKMLCGKTWFPGVDDTPIAAATSAEEPATTLEPATSSAVEGAPAPMVFSALDKAITEMFAAAATQLDDICVVGVGDAASNGDDFYQNMASIPPPEMIFTNSTSAGGSDKEREVYDPRSDKSAPAVCAALSVTTYRMHMQCPVKTPNGWKEKSDRTHFPFSELGDDDVCTSFNPADNGATPKPSFDQTKLTAYCTVLDEELAKMEKDLFTDTASNPAQAFKDSECEHQCYQFCDGTLLQEMNEYSYFATGCPNAATVRPGFEDLVKRVCKSCLDLGSKMIEERGHHPYDWFLDNSVWATSGARMAYLDPSSKADKSGGVVTSNSVMDQSNKDWHTGDFWAMESCWQKHLASWGHHAWVSESIKPFCTVEGACEAFTRYAQEVVDVTWAADGSGRLPPEVKKKLNEMHGMSTEATDPYAGKTGGCFDLTGDMEQYKRFCLSVANQFLEKFGQELSIYELGRADNIAKMAKGNTCDQNENDSDTETESCFNLSLQCSDIHNSCKSSASKDDKEGEKKRLLGLLPTAKAYDKSIAEIQKKRKLTARSNCVGKQGEEGKEDDKSSEGGPDGSDQKDMGPKYSRIINYDAKEFSKECGLVFEFIQFVIPAKREAFMGAVKSQIELNGKTETWNFHNHHNHDHWACKNRCEDWINTYSGNVGSKCSTDQKNLFKDKFENYCETQCADFVKPSCGEKISRTFESAETLACYAEFTGYALFHWKKPLNGFCSIGGSLKYDKDKLYPVCRNSDPLAVDKDPICTDLKETLFGTNSICKQSTDDNQAFYDYMIMKVRVKNEDWFMNSPHDMDRVQDELFPDVCCAIGKPEAWADYCAKPDPVTGAMVPDADILTNYAAICPKGCQKQMAAMVTVNSDPVVYEREKKTQEQRFNFEMEMEWRSAWDVFRPEPFYVTYDQNLCDQCRRSCHMCANKLNQGFCDLNCSDQYCGHSEKFQYMLYDGMKCDKKKQILEQQKQARMTRAFLYTGRDVITGCTYYLNNWLTYVKETVNWQTQECDEDDFVCDDDNWWDCKPNPKWFRDPCCNHEFRKFQCCAPRTLSAIRTVPKNVKTDLVSGYVYSKYMDNQAKAKASSGGARLLEYDDIKDNVATQDGSKSLRYSKAIKEARARYAAREARKQVLKSRFLKGSSFEEPLKDHMIPEAKKNLRGSASMKALLNAMAADKLEMPSENAEILDQVSEMQRELATVDEATAKELGKIAVSAVNAYVVSETKAARTCFASFQSFLTSVTKEDLFRTCQEAVRGTYNDYVMTYYGSTCTSNADCYTGVCEEVPQPSWSTNTNVRNCISPLDVTDPPELTGDFIVPMLKCLFKLGTASNDENRDIKRTFLTQVLNFTPAEAKTKTWVEISAKVLQIYGTAENLASEWDTPLKARCIGQGNMSEKNTKEKCEAVKVCNWDRALSGTACTDPCHHGLASTTGIASCPKYCYNPSSHGYESNEVSIFPLCISALAQSNQNQQVIRSEFDQCNQDLNTMKSACSDSCHKCKHEGEHPDYPGGWHDLWKECKKRFKAKAEADGNLDDYKRDHCHPHAGDDCIDMPYSYESQCVNKELCGFEPTYNGVTGAKVHCEECWNEEPYEALLNCKNVVLDQCKKFDSDVEQIKRDSKHNWQCIIGKHSYTNDKETACLAGADCMASGGPQPSMRKSCYGKLNSDHASHDSCWKLGAGWLEPKYPQMSALATFFGGHHDLPPEYCWIRSYQAEILAGGDYKPYLQPPRFGFSCPTHCEDTLSNRLHCDWEIRESCSQAFDFLTMEPYYPNGKPDMEAGTTTATASTTPIMTFYEYHEDCSHRDCNSLMNDFPDWSLISADASCNNRNEVKGLCTRIMIQRYKKDNGVNDVAFESNKCLTTCHEWKWNDWEDFNMKVFTSPDLSSDCQWDLTKPLNSTQPCANSCSWQQCEAVFMMCKESNTDVFCNTQVKEQLNQCRGCQLIRCNEKCESACNTFSGSNRFWGAEDTVSSCSGCDSGDTTKLCRPGATGYNDKPTFMEEATYTGASCGTLCERDLNDCVRSGRGVCHKPYTLPAAMVTASAVQVTNRGHSLEHWCHRAWEYLLRDAFNAVKAYHLSTNGANDPVTGNTAKWALMQGQWNPWRYTAGLTKADYQKLSQDIIHSLIGGMDATGTTSTTATINGIVYSFSKTGTINNYHNHEDGKEYTVALGYILAEFNSLNGKCWKCNGQWNEHANEREVKYPWSTNIQFETCKAETVLDFPSCSNCELGCSSDCQSRFDSIQNCEWQDIDPTSSAIGWGRVCSKTTAQAETELNAIAGCTTCIKKRCNHRCKDSCDKFENFWDHGRECGGCTLNSPIPSSGETALCAPTATCYQGDLAGKSDSGTPFVLRGTTNSIETCFGNTRRRRRMMMEEHYYDDTISRLNQMETKYPLTASLLKKSYVENQIEKEKAYLKKSRRILRKVSREKESAKLEKELLSMKNIGFRQLMNSYYNEGLTFGDQKLKSQLGARYSLLRNEIGKNSHLLKYYTHLMSTLDKEIYESERSKDLLYQNALSNIQKANLEKKKALDVAHSRRALDVDADHLDALDYEDEDVVSAYAMMESDMQKDNYRKVINKASEESAMKLKQSKRRSLSKENTILSHLSEKRRLREASQSNKFAWYQYKNSPSHDIENGSNSAKHVHLMDYLSTAEDIERLKATNKKLLDLYLIKDSMYASITGSAIRLSKPSRKLKVDTVNSSLKVKRSLLTEAEKKDWTAANSEIALLSEELQDKDRHSLLDDIYVSQSAGNPFGSDSKKYMNLQSMVAKFQHARLNEEDLIDRKRRLQEDCFADKSIIQQLSKKVDSDFHVQRMKDVLGKDMIGNQQVDVRALEEEFHTGPMVTLHSVHPYELDLDVLFKYSKWQDEFKVPQEKATTTDMNGILMNPTGRALQAIGEIVDKNLENCSTGETCTDTETACTKFFTRTDQSAARVNAAFTSNAFGQAPWDTTDKACNEIVNGQWNQRDGALCFISKEDAITLLEAARDKFGQSAKIDHDHYQNTDCGIHNTNLDCDGCMTIDPDNWSWSTCPHDCRCSHQFNTTVNIRARINQDGWRSVCEMMGTFGNWQIDNYGQAMYSLNSENKLRRHWQEASETPNEKPHYWFEWDSRLLSGAGGCIQSGGEWIYDVGIPNSCYRPANHDWSNYDWTTCLSYRTKSSKQCMAIKDEVDGNGDAQSRLTFFATLKLWIDGVMNSESLCTAKACNPDFWIENETDCEKRSYCQGGGCKKCRTEQWYDRQQKAAAVQCIAADVDGNHVADATTCSQVGGTFFNITSNRAICKITPISSATGDTDAAKCASAQSESTAISGVTGTNTTYYHLPFTCEMLSLNECNTIQNVENWNGATGNTLAALQNSLKCRLEEWGKCETQAECDNAGECEWEIHEWSLRQYAEKDGGWCTFPYPYNKEDFPIGWDHHHAQNHPEYTNSEGTDSNDAPVIDPWRPTRGFHASGEHSGHHHVCMRNAPIGYICRSTTNWGGSGWGCFCLKATLQDTAGASSNTDFAGKLQTLFDAAKTATPSKFSPASSMNHDFAANWATNHYFTSGTMKGDNEHHATSFTFKLPVDIDLVLRPTTGMTQSECNSLGMKWYPKAFLRSECIQAGSAWKVASNQNEYTDATLTDFQANMTSRTSFLGSTTPPPVTATIDERRRAAVTMNMRAKNTNMPTAGVYGSGTEACCATYWEWGGHGHCESWSKDDFDTCRSCGSKWMSFTRWRRHGTWINNKWDKFYTWRDRETISTNSWIIEPTHQFGELFNNVITEATFIPMGTFIQCRGSPTLGCLTALTDEKVPAQSFGSAAAETDTQIDAGDGSFRITQVVQVSSGGQRLLEAGGPNGELTNENGAGLRELTTPTDSTVQISLKTVKSVATTCYIPGVSPSATATNVNEFLHGCYTVVKHTDASGMRYVGQLQGDCLEFNLAGGASSVTANVCLTIDSLLSKNTAAFTTNDVGTLQNVDVNGTALVGQQPFIQPMNIVGGTTSVSSSGVTLFCADVTMSPGRNTYCPILRYSDYQSVATRNSTYDCPNIAQLEAQIAKDVVVFSGAASGKIDMMGNEKVVAFSGSVFGSSATATTAADLERSSASSLAGQTAVTQPPNTGATNQQAGAGNNNANANINLGSFGGAAKAQQQSAVLGGSAASGGGALTTAPSLMSNDLLGGVTANADGIIAITGAAGEQSIIVKKAMVVDFPLELKGEVAEACNTRAKMFAKPYPFDTTNMCHAIRGQLLSSIRSTFINQGSNVFKNINSTQTVDDPNMGIYTMFLDPIAGGTATATEIEMDFYVKVTDATEGNALVAEANVLTGFFNTAFAGVINAEIAALTGAANVLNTNHFKVSTDAGSVVLGTATLREIQEVATLAPTTDANGNTVTTAAPAKTERTFIESAAEMQASVSTTCDSGTKMMSANPECVAFRNALKTGIFESIASVFTGDLKMDKVAISDVGVTLASRRELEVEADDDGIYYGANGEMQSKGRNLSDAIKESIKESMDNVLHFSTTVKNVKIDLPVHAIDVNPYDGSVSRRRLSGVSATLEVKYKVETEDKSQAAVMSSQISSAKDKFESKMQKRITKAIASSPVLQATGAYNVAGVTQKAINVTTEAIPATSSASSTSDNLGIILAIVGGFVVISSLQF